MNEDYLIEKWLNDELTNAELEAFKNLEDCDLYTKIVESSKRFKASSFSSVVDFETFNERISEQRPVISINWFKPMLRLTGVFVLGMGIYFMFFYNNMIQIQTAVSEKNTFLLPDSSKVILNALSEVSYSKNRWNRNREVVLSGEAFFKVTKGSVFEVITPEGKVTVLGTQFNVKQRDHYFEIKCFEGVVQVTSDDYSKKLVAGETFRIYDGVVTFDTTIFQNPQWTKNVSNFKSIPLSEVIAELERQYNIKVVNDNIKINRLFTGGFVHNNLENALKSITEPLDLNYTIDNSNQVRLYDSKK